MSVEPQSWAEAFQELLRVKMEGYRFSGPPAKAFNLLVQAVGAEMERFDERLAAMEQPCEHKPWRPMGSKGNWHMMVLQDGPVTEYVDLCEKCHRLYPSNKEGEPLESS